MKSIVTEYGGYKFRSRLEARWTVFLDAVREPWEYEVEGYDVDEAATCARWARFEHGEVLELCALPSRILPNTVDYEGLPF